MQAVDDALYDLLTGDAELVQLLGQYDGQPAVFTEVPIPTDAVPPYIVVAPPDVDVPFDTKNSWGREWQRVLTACQLATGDGTVVDALAERMRNLLHRQHLSLGIPATAGSAAPGGMATIVANVDNVLRAPTDDTLYARAVLLTLKSTYR